MGEHWLSSVMAALAVGVEAGVSLQKAAEAIAEVEPFAARMQPVYLPSGAVVLRDDYQASADVAEAAFRVLEKAEASRKILAVTDLSDLGRNIRQRRKYLAEAAARVADVLVLIGDRADYGARRAVAQGMPEENVFAFEDVGAASEFLKGELRGGDLVLLKGRTSDHVSRVLWAQFGEVGCELQTCPKMTLCDECWELGVGEGTRAALEAVSRRTS